MRFALAGCAVLVAALATNSAAAQQPPVELASELAIARRTPRIDGDLAEWPAASRGIRLAEAAQVTEGAGVWGGAADASASFLLAFDTNHLYLAGRVEDDQPGAATELVALDRTDRIELHLGFTADGDRGSMAPEDSALLLMPLQAARPWSWADTGRLADSQSASQLAGIRVAARRVDATHYEFEAAFPFHHFPALRPGCASFGCNLALRDHDPGDGGKSVVLTWNGRDPGTAQGLGRLTLAAPGPLVALADASPLLSGELLGDLRYLLVPIATLAVLVVLLRAWPSVRARAPWLRPALIGVGAVLFLVGLVLPGVLSDWRAGAQREQLDTALSRLNETLRRGELGTLGSYRGASRDRALVQLLAGESIARQRYTSYRPLAQIVPEQFGPAVREFDGLPVRPYWLPLAVDQAESFQFDPPLRGSTLHVVVGRPFAPAFSFAPRAAAAPRLELELDYGGSDKRRQQVELDGPFADGSALGRDHWQVCVMPLRLDRDLRALTVAVARGLDFRLVGISLEGAQPGSVEPVMLGTPSREGVLTDLRGPYPLDAGIELAPGAAAKVTIPATQESPQRLWFFYRAIYPGVPTANPGAKVAELVLHFGNGKQKRTVVLEHQVSVFYELAFRNTRDEPPDDSPASIALSWTDESKELHVNLGYPITDLPADALLEAIEFRNRADYRMHFRSVVFVNERAAAPQDPPDSPFVREGPNVRLDAQVVEELRGTAVTIYRDGRLSESTLPAERQLDVPSAPRTVAGSGPAASETVLSDGSRRAVLFAPLRGEGWDGAVLGVATTDLEWAGALRSVNQWALVLCLASAPFFLVLLSELLAAATNLRVRLMTVTTVASLAPLGLMSLVLVQVLEGGHAADVEDGMRATVRSALGQLDSQKAKVETSAQQWLSALTKLAAAKLEGVDEPHFEAALPTVGSELQKLLVGQLPPEWHGGFLRLEWRPALGKVTPAPLVHVAGDERMATVETPARLEPGVFMQWGVLMLGVRAEQKVHGGTFTLTAGRPLDGALLGALAPGHEVLLTDVRGYPLAASADKPEAALHQRQALDPATMLARERAVNLGLEQRQPIVERLSSNFGSHVFGSEVLRDLQDTPRALLLVAQPDQRATLDLAVGRIPVRAFFLLVAGSLVVLSVFLSFVVSGRISRPIERLEHGAQALSRGRLDTRVPVDDGGQIGRLTRAFNQMAADLQARLLDLQALNRTMVELTAEHDEATTVEVLRRFCRAHTPADSVHVLLADAVRQQLAVHAGSTGEARAVPHGSLSLAALAGAFSAASRRGSLPGPWPEVAPASRSVVGLPIAFGGQTRGVVLLGFTRDEPLAVDLDLLSTVVAQAAVAFERCQLQRLAVQDPVTATFTPEYFRRRIVDEVSLAQQRGRALSLLAVVLGDGDRRPRGLRRFAAMLRERLPRDVVLCHAGGGQFQAALPGVRRVQAEAYLADVAAAWGELVAQLPENEVEEARPAGVVVQFPDEAASAEFLFEALRARLLALHTPGASAMESDESLQRAGVTAISPAMRAVYGALRRVAPTDLPILLEGETGVGKEVLTNLVHRWSRRAGGPLIKVHCAALSETLLASELFGHEKGAFTGADRRKIGRFEQADGGTLFLDEVGEIPLDVQVKLLRVLQEGEVDRVGGTEPVKVDVRVVAATNRDISRLVADGRFREDLYYRLQGMVVVVPPLRERKQELAELVEHFRAEIVAGGHAQARAWSTEPMEELFRQEWPGNIRELRNTVFRAMVMARGEVVQLRDLQAVLAGAAPTATAANVAAAGAPPEGPPPVETPPPVLESPVAAPASGARNGAATADSPVDIPRPVPHLEPNGAPRAEPGQPTVLPPRLRELYQAIVARGQYSTHDHMEQHSLSHRTALRDLQALVTSGFIERVGSRRGAFYRPADRSGRIADAPSPLD